MRQLKKTPNSTHQLNLGYLKSQIYDTAWDCRMMIQNQD